MRKGLFIFLCGFLLMHRIFAQKSTDSDVNLRSAPTTDAQILTTIPKGTKVTVIEKTNDKWYRVEYNGKKGYMAASAVDGVSNQAQADNNNAADHTSDNGSSKKNSNNSAKTKKVKVKKDKSDGSTNYGNDKHTFGLGVKLGVPTGITLKYITDKKLALEFQGGFTPNTSGYYGRYHRGRYSNYHNGYYYDDYYVNRMTSLLFNIQYQSSVGGKIPELDWFAGGGIQVNFVEFRSAYYNGYYNGYYYNNGYGYYDSFTETNVGINLHGGAEYFFMNRFKIPFSAFADLGTYIEIANYPGSAFMIGGVGARFWVK